MFQPGSYSNKDGPAAARAHKNKLDPQQKSYQKASEDGLFPDPKDANHMDKSALDAEKWISGVSSKELMRCGALDHTLRNRLVKKHSSQQLGMFHALQPEPEFSRFRYSRLTPAFLERTESAPNIPSTLRF